MKALCSVLLLAAVFCTATAAVAQKYTVYCANGKVEVDTRDEKQMKSARGSNTYAMSSFNYLTDANKFAQKIGKTCPKK